MSPLFYLIVVLLVAWLLIRAYAGRLDAQRVRDREERMERLLDEQESLLLAEAAPGTPGSALAHDPTWPVASPEGSPEPTSASGLEG